MITGFVLVNTTNFGAAQEGLILYINTDTVWTKANSPYNLTGPVVVRTGVTLTITEGVTVNLKNYYIYVNGTLKILGTQSEKVHIDGGSITFGEGNQVGTNSKLAYVTLNAQITSNNPLTVTHSDISSTVTAGNSSTFSNNNANSFVTLANSATVSNNLIHGSITVGDDCVFSYNTIYGDVDTGNTSMISHNTIKGGSEMVVWGGHYNTLALTVNYSSIIKDNTIIGGVSAISSTISNNVISGGAEYTDLMGRSADYGSALLVSGESLVTSNVLYSDTGGYGLTLYSGNVTVSNNLIKNMLRVASNAVIDSNYFDGSGIQIGDIFIPAFNNIDLGSGNSIIKNNIINGAGRNSGIFSRYIGGSAVIEKNLIMNCTCGIGICSQASIQQNTFFNCSAAIQLSKYQNSTPKISHNNIINCSKYNVYLDQTPADVDAANNWWGTTDSQNISLAIFDSKYDFNLGTVGIAPISNSFNSEAPDLTYTLNVPVMPSANPTVTPNNSPTPTVPEYPTSTIFLVILVSTLTVISIKKAQKSH